jgi:hypothetical protein
MATYAQGVSQYIPQIQPYQPDYNFLSQGLQLKQSQYDQNWNSLNKVYGQYFYADVTHDQSKKNKDNLIKQIEFNLGRVSGLDLSLEKNVNQAMQVFKPFYEDSNLMYDMAWTKNTANQKGVGEGKRNSTDAETNKQYWGDGIKFIDYKIEEFKNSSYDNIRSVGDVKYTPYVNVGEMAAKLAKDTKLTIPTVKFENGFIIKQVNGQPLIEPLAQLFQSVLGNDPMVKAVYETQAYVDRKDYAYGYKDKFNGDIQAAENEYLNDSLKTLRNQTNSSYRNLENANSVYTSNIAKLEASLKNGTANPNTQASLDNFRSALETNNNLLTRTKDDLTLLGENINQTANTKGGSIANEDLESLRFRVDRGMANLLMDEDLQASANSLQNMNADLDITANPFVVNERKHAQNMAEIGYRSREAQKLAILKDMLEDKTTTATNLSDKAKLKLPNLFEIDPATGEVIPKTELNNVREEIDLGGGGKVTGGVDPKKQQKKVGDVLKASATAYTGTMENLLQKFVGDKTMTKEERSKILGQNPFVDPNSFTGKMLKNTGINLTSSKYNVDRDLTLTTLKSSADKLFAWAQKHKDVPGVATNSSLIALVNGYNDIDDFDDVNQIVAKNKKDIGNEQVNRLSADGFKYTSDLLNKDGSIKTQEQWIASVTKNHPNDLSWSKVPDYAEMLEAGLLGSTIYGVLSNFSKGTDFAGGFARGTKGAPIILPDGKVLDKSGKIIKATSNFVNRIPGKYKLPAAIAAGAIGVGADLFANGAAAGWNYLFGDSNNNVTLKNAKTSGLLSYNNSLPDEYNEMKSTLEDYYTNSKIKTKVAGIFGGPGSGTGLASNGTSTISIQSGEKLYNGGFPMFMDIVNHIKNLDITSKGNGFSLNGIGTGARLGTETNETAQQLYNLLIKDAQNKDSKLGLFDMSVSSIAMGNIDKAAIIFKPSQEWWDKLKPGKDDETGIWGKTEQPKDSKWYVSGDDTPITPLEKWQRAQKEGIAVITDASNLAGVELYKHSVMSPMEMIISEKGSKTYRDPVDPNNYFTTFSKSETEGLYDRTDNFLLYDRTTGKDVSRSVTTYNIPGTGLLNSRTQFYDQTIPEMKLLRQNQFNY